MKIAAISLSREGALIAAKLAAAWPQCDVFLHVSVTGGVETVCKRFDRVVALTAEIFSAYQGLIYIAPVGAVVRAIAPCLRHKTVDPAVVAVDIGGRWAVSLLSGHEGGANDLAVAVANILGAEPIVSTTTEAAKDLIIGIGCRSGVAADAIIAAVGDALSLAGCNLAQVRLLASADIKADEPGLGEAAQQLGLPLRLIPAEEIRQTARTFEHSAFVQEKVDLPAVAEPAALLAGSRTRLILPKQILHGVTVAIARESGMASE
jgi:cobalt-precorrin 5A hydrolase